MSATTGVLPFLRGIDLSRNDLQVSPFPVPGVPANTCNRRTGSRKRYAA